MSKTSYSSDNANYIKQSYATQSTAQVFHRTASKSVDPLMSPLDLKFRESRDSDLFPNSTALILGLDITGSMGKIPEHMVREELPSLIEVSVKNGVRDPAVLFVAVGDHKCDDAPLQIGQFESDEVHLNKWLTSVYIEGNGGGNNGESYALVWYVAAKKTSIDCFEKRGEKGFLFTYGDEHCHPIIEAEAGTNHNKWGLRDIFGSGEYQDMTAKQLLKMAREKYHVFHVHCAESSDSDSSVVDGWKKLLGENLLILEHKEDLTKLIATTMALYAGASLKNVTKDFDSKTALSIQTALAHVDAGALAKKSDATTGIAKF